MTGESWSEAIARPLIFGLNPPSAMLGATFYVSFLILTQLVLNNVVIAVLLDKFTVSPADTADAHIEELVAGTGAVSEDATASPTRHPSQINPIAKQQQLEQQLQQQLAAMQSELVRLEATVNEWPAQLDSIRQARQRRVPQTTPRMQDSHSDRDHIFTEAHVDTFTASAPAARVPIID